MKKKNIHKKKAKAVVKTNNVEVKQVIEKTTEAKVEVKKKSFKESIIIDILLVVLALSVLLFIHHFSLKNNYLDDSYVYYTNEEDYKIINEYFNNEKKKYDEFYVELKPLKVFYDAEEYHQDYLDKNINGYCHLNKVEYDNIKKLNKVGE